MLRQRPAPAADDGLHPSGLGRPDYVSILPRCAPKPPGVETQEWAAAVAAARQFWKQLLVGTLDIARGALGEAICEQLKELGKSSALEADGHAARGSHSLDRTVRQVME